MLAPKVPVHVALPEASRPVQSAHAGSDRHRDRGASAEAAKSQDLRRFAPTPERKTYAWNDTDLPPFRIIATPSKVLVRFPKKSGRRFQQVKLQVLSLRYS